MGEEPIPAWAQEIRERLIRLETKFDQKFDQYNKVSDTAYEARNTAEGCADDIKEIKASLTWSWRTIAGAIMASLVAAYMQLKGGN
jgi:hypothetical protein